MERIDYGWSGRVLWSIFLFCFLIEFVPFSVAKYMFVLSLVSFAPAKCLLYMSYINKPTPGPRRLMST